MPCRHPRWPDIGLVIIALCVAGGFIAFWAGVITVAADAVDAARIIFH